MFVIQFTVAFIGNALTNLQNPFENHISLNHKVTIVLSFCIFTEPIVSPRVNPGMRVKPRAHEPVPYVDRLKQSAAEAPPTKHRTVYGEHGLGYCLLTKWELTLLYRKRNNVKNLTNIFFQMFFKRVKWSTISAIIMLYYRSIPINSSYSYEIKSLHLWKNSISLDFFKKTSESIPLQLFLLSIFIGVYHSGVNIYAFFFIRIFFFFQLFLLFNRPIQIWIYWILKLFI